MNAFHTQTILLIALDYHALQRDLLPTILPNGTRCIVVASFETSTDVAFRLTDPLSVASQDSLTCGATRNAFHLGPRLLSCQVS